MRDKTKKALLIIAVINSVLVLGAITAGIIVSYKAELNLSLYLPVFAVCALIMIAGNISLWNQVFRGKKK